MTNIYIAKNGQQLGPFDEYTISNMLQLGDCYADDLCWKQGNTDWQSIRIALPHLCTFSPPPVPCHVQSNVPAPPVMPRTSQIEFTDLFWLVFVVLTVLTTFLGVVVDLVWLSSEDAGIAAFLLSSPAWIAGIVLTVWLHYRLWHNLPEKYRATSPAKAIGFLFIPFFNFYWAFISFPKLSEGMFNWSTNVESSPPHDSRGLAMACAVVFVFSFTLGLLPLLSSIIGIASTVVLLVYYYQVLNAQKQLVLLSGNRVRPIKT